MSNSIIFPNAKFWIEDDGILYCKFSNCDLHHKLDLERALEYVRAISKLCDGKPRSILIDLRNVVGTYEISAAKLFAEHPVISKLKISEAYVLDSIGMKLLIITYKRIFDPKTPHKIFSTIEAAKQYCLESKERYYANN